MYDRMLNGERMTVPLYTEGMVRRSMKTINMGEGQPPDGLAWEVNDDSV